MESISLSNLTNIPDTPYQIQLGKISGHLTLRVLKGNVVNKIYIIDKIGHELDITGLVRKIREVLDINSHLLTKLVTFLLDNHISSQLGRMFDGDHAPFPYIFTSPTPPGDLGLVAEAQAKINLEKITPPNEISCKYCGNILPEGQSICPTCRNKVI